MSGAADVLAVLDRAYQRLGLGAVGAAMRDIEAVRPAVDELTASLEWALDRIRAAGLGEGERFAQAEAALVKAVHS